MPEERGFFRKTEWFIIVLLTIYLLPGIVIFVCEFVLHTDLWWGLPPSVQRFFTTIYWIPYLVLIWLLRLLGW